MSVEWFDLGARLHAASVGRVAPRLLHSPVCPSSLVVAVRAVMGRGRVSVTVCSPGGAVETAAGAGALDLLGRNGIRIGAERPVTLVTDTAGTLPALAVLCARRGLHEDVAAHVGWWLDRADFPAGRAVVDVVAACQGRWVTGLPPQAEQSAGVWREWVGVTDRGLRGVIELYRAVCDGPVLPDVAAMAEDDVFAWQLAQRAAEDGRDWRVPDRPARAAAGLRARCDAADLYAAALLTDPIWQARAVHTGHATVGEFAGTAGVRPRRGTVIARRLDSRLRPGKVIAGHAGEAGASGAPFAATVDGTRVEDGRLVLTLTGVTGTVSDGVVTLLEAPPNVWSQRRSRMTYGALYKRRSSWLSTGRTPPVARRDVPLAVLVAGADRDDERTTP